MKNTYSLLILFSVCLTTTSLISCVSIGSNNNDLDQEESQNKTLFLKLISLHIYQKTIYMKFRF